MPDILNSAQTQIDDAAKQPYASAGASPPTDPSPPLLKEEALLPGTAPTNQSQPTDPLLNDLHLPYSSRGQKDAPDHTEVEPPLEPEPIPPIPPPVKKKGGTKPLLVAALLFLFITLPLSVYFISQRQQVTESRSRADTSVCCEGGTCEDGWSYEGDDTYPFGTCADRVIAACTPHPGTGTRTGGGPCAGGGDPTPTPGGGGGGNTSYYRDGRCLDGGGNLAETCGDSKRCNIGGGCDPACGPANGIRSDGQICDVLNGYCRTEYSCRPPNGGGGATPTPGGGGNGNLCRYVNTGTNVSVDGNCSGYTFRKLVFQCNGPLSLSSTQRCEDKGIHPGFESIIEDQTGATSVSLGSISNCKSRQADLIVIGRPAGDTICPAGNPSCSDELPGTPRVANYVKAGGSQSNCGGGRQQEQQQTVPTATSAPNPTPTPTPAPTCESIRVYDAAGVDITASLANNSRTLTIGEQVTLATSRGSATGARFRIQGIADWAENDPSKTTATEYRLTITIPSTLTQAQGTFEVEVFVNGVWK